MQARDGEEGRRIFRGVSADLVLTDLVMPNQEGIGHITELRKADPDLGIIAMSGGLAHDAPFYLRIAKGLGAHRTLKKPFELTTLVTVIDEGLAHTGKAAPSIGSDAAAPPAGGASVRSACRNNAGAKPLFEQRPEENFKIGLNGGRCFAHGLFAVIRASCAL